MDVELPGRRDKADDRALAHQLDNAPAERFAGGVEILPDIGEAIIALGVGVVGEDGDPRFERSFGRLVEGVQVDQRYRDAVHLLGDRRVHAFTICDFQFVPGEGA